MVEWRLPIYEVKQSNNGYIIQTAGSFKGNYFGKRLVGTFLYITPRDESDRQLVENLKTGDVIAFKGIIDDITMRNLDIKPAILIDDERLSKKLLSNTYGKYNQKFNCWTALVTDQNGEHTYCIRLGRIDKVQVDTVDRYYILAFGDVVNDEGEPNGSHADTGMVGAFIIEERSGEPITIASHTTMQIGAFGNAPTSWKFVKLGSNNYWGWQTIIGDCHHGDCEDQHVLLAPYGKDIRDLTGGAIGGSSSDRESKSISVSLAIDSSQNNAQIFPLLLSVNGEFNGKEVPTKNLTVPFDKKAWRYIMPHAWQPQAQESSENSEPMQSTEYTTEQFEDNADIAPVTESQRSVPLSGSNESD